MRTTIRIDPDLAVRLRKVARDRGISFASAANAALRAGLGQRPSSRPYRIPARKLRLRPGIDLDRASQLAASLEDAETVRKLELRK